MCDVTDVLGAAAASLLKEVDKLEWWKKYTDELSAACKLVLLVQP